MGATEITGHLLVGDARLFYRMIGEGPAVILLHGYGQSQSIFSQIEYYLKDSYRVVLLDTRGHGASETGAHPLTFSLLADDVATVMAHLQIEKAALVGYSDGGNTCLQMAVSHPQCLTGILAISSNTTPKGLKPITGFFIQAGYRALKGLCRIGLPLSRQLQLLNLLANQPQITSDQLRQVTLPTVLVAAQRDIIRPQHTAMQAAAIPHSRLIIVKKSGHISVLKKWRQYIHLVDDIVKGG